MIKKIFARMLILLASSLILSGSFPYLTLAQETRVYVNPSNITGLEIGDTFQINITVSDVTDLYSWQFSLFYQNDILNATSIVQGPFLLTHPNPNASTWFYPHFFTDTYNSTHGLIFALSSLTEVEGGVSGTGTLATITFKVKGEGDCLLALRDIPEPIKLLDSAVVGNLIPHTTTDGIVHVGLHDIAIVNTKTSKTITNDTIVYVNVTIENQGQMTETFTVTSYYNSTPIETKTVTNLTTGNTAIVTFIWDTKTIPKGNYTIRADASTIPGETDTADNTYINGWILETIMGDVTGDGKVNILDISLVAMAFGSNPKDPEWDPNADINNNNEINILDISAVAIHFGEVDP